MSIEREGIPGTYADIDPDDLPDGDAGDLTPNIPSCRISHTDIGYRLPVSHINYPNPHGHKNVIGITDNQVH